MQRIGVFVCHCGSNIAATVDVKKVVEIIAKEPGVVHAEDYQYMCSEAGQSRIQEAIREKNLTGVVVCSCSPRMHEATFRKAAEKAGLNPYMVEIANIREHCSWIHKDMQEATEKAVILARAAVAKVNLNAPLQPGESQVTKRALIIGGGIAGIQTALDIADAGYEVDIVEKTPSIGGRMSQLDKTFPTLDCSACILTPKMVEAAAHEKINIYSSVWMEDITHVTRKGSSKFTLTNTNKLLRSYEGCMGLKTGSTSIAKYCLSAVAERNGITLIASVMAAPDPKTRFRDAAALLNYGFSKCTLYLDDALEPLKPLKLRKGVKEQVPLVYRGKFRYISTDGTKPDNVKKKLILPKEQSAPVKKGQKAGAQEYYQDGKKIGSLDILYGETIKKAGYHDWLERTCQAFLL